MKAKVIILLLICAVVTLSFTVASTHKASAAGAASTAQAAEPVGGMASEDPIN